MDYEIILHEIGGCGPFQIGLCLLLGLTTLKAGLDQEMLIFQFYTPKKQCIEPYISSLDSRDFGPSCSQKMTNFTDQPKSNSMLVCTNWNYSETYVKSTVVTDFNWVCSNSYLAEWVQSIFFIGAAIGNVVGFFGDKIGRRKTLIIFCIIDFLSSALLVISPGVILHLILRFFKGLATCIVNQGMIILAEVSSKEYRSAIGIAYWFFFSVGYVISACVAFYFPYWHTMQWITTIPCLSYIILFFMVPESPRWLMLRGKCQEAIKVLKQIAKINGRNLSEHIFDNIIIKPDPKGNFQELFASKRIIGRFCLISFLQTIACIIYSGISINSHFASENIFLNVIIMGLIEFPGYPVAWFLCEFVGRKPSVATLLLTGSFAIMATPFITIRWIHILVATVGKFLVGNAYSIADVIVTEAFPTSIRNLTVYMIFLISSSVTVIVPEINKLNTTYDFLPNSIYGVLGIICSFLVFAFLLETRNRPLPQTVAEDCSLNDHGLGESESMLKIVEFNTESDQENEDQMVDINSTKFSSLMIQSIHFVTDR